MPDRSDIYTDMAVILGLFYLMLPFMILPLYASIEKLDRRLLEASRDLGAGVWATMVRVVWPLTLPGIMAGCTLVFVPTMGPGDPVARYRTAVMGRMRLFAFGVPALIGLMSGLVAQGYWDRIQLFLHGAQLAQKTVQALAGRAPADGCNQGLLGNLPADFYRSASNQRG